MNDALPPEQAAMQQAQEFVRFLIALASAVIGFSTTLIDRAALHDTYYLHGIWVLMSVSIFCGMLCYSRTIVMLSKSKFSLTDRFLEFPGRIQQGAFIFGMLVVGVTLVVVARDPSKIGEVTTNTSSREAGIVAVIDAINRMQRPLIDEEMKISTDIGTSLYKLDRLSADTQRLREANIADVTRLERDLELEKTSYLASMEILRTTLNEQTTILRNIVEGVQAVKDRVEELPFGQVDAQPLLTPKCDFVMGGIGGGRARCTFEQAPTKPAGTILPR
jgi:hypothetical protein